METISNIASSASKAIWGEQAATTQNNETAGTEPVSGLKGKGDLNEPFDKGNEPFDKGNEPFDKGNQSNSSTPHALHSAQAHVTHSHTNSHSHSVSTRH
jgi:hypothetical protein